MTDQEYNHCVHQHADHLYRFIVKNLRHTEDAQDVVQTTYEKLWRNRLTVDFATAKSLLFTMGYHLMIDHLRKQKKTELKEDFDRDTRTTRQETPQLKQILEQALNRLSATQKSLIMLKDYEGYSYEEIGKITGLSLAQVKVYLHRARLSMKEYLVSPDHVLMND